MRKDLWKKSGGIEVIWEVKYFGIDTQLIKKKEYIIGVLLPIIRSQQKYYTCICFNMFSAYYNNNSSVSPSKNNSTKSHILLEPIQIPPAINRISLPSQSTAPEESLAPIFVASEQGLDTSVYKRVFKPPRLKSQI